MMWTPEQTEMLKTMRAKGATFTQVANAINAAFGTKLTRCAVGGKVDRLAAPKVRGPRGHNLKRQPKSLRRAKPLFLVREPKVIEAPLPPTCAPILLMERKPLQCSWVIGETAGPDTKCCGAPISKKSWCSYHAAIGWCPKRINGEEGKRKPTYHYLDRIIAA